MSKRIGGYCKDGTYTTATGRGAGSHHGGIAHWVYAETPSSNTYSSSSSAYSGYFRSNSNNTNTYTFNTPKKQPKK